MASYEISSKKKSDFKRIKKLRAFENFREMIDNISERNVDYSILDNLDIGFIDTCNSCHGDGYYYPKEYQDYGISTNGPKTGCGKCGGSGNYNQYGRSNLIKGTGKVRYSISISAGIDKVTFHISTEPSRSIFW